MSKAILEMYVEVSTALVKMHNEMCEIYQITSDPEADPEDALHDITRIASKALD